MPEIRQCVQPRVNFNNDVAAAAAVAAVRAACRDILLPAEADVAVSAFA